MNPDVSNFYHSAEPTQFAGGVLGALLMVAMVGVFQLLRWSYVKLTQTKIVNEQEKESFLVERYTLSDSQRLELFALLKMCDGEFSGPNLDFLCASQTSVPMAFRPHKKTDRWEVYLVFERRWEKGRVWKSQKWERYGYTVFRITDDELSQAYTQQPPPLDLKKLAEDIFKQDPEVVTDND